MKYHSARWAPGAARAWLMVAALLLAACAPEPPKSTLEVTDAHMPLPPPGVKMAAIYLRLANTGAEDARLLEVQTDVAGVAEVHRSIYQDGVVRMREVPHPVVPAGGELLFEPGGYHVMLMDLAELPGEGGQFDLRLTFEGGETLVAPVTVRAR